MTMRWINILVSGTSHLVQDNGVTVCGKPGWGHHRTTERPVMTVCQRCRIECPT